MALRTKRNGQRTSPALPPVKPQAVVVQIPATFKPHRMSQTELADTKAWISETAAAARLAEKTGMTRKDVVGILIHAHP